MHSYQRQTTR